MDNYYDNNNFDIDKFNKRFKEIQDEEKNKNKLEREEYLKTLEEEDETKKVTDLTVKEIIINTKNEIFDLIYEIISFDFEGFNGFTELLVKNNRLFYIGIFLLFICFILYFLSNIFYYPSDKKDININIPNDYSFNYKPYEVQTNQQSEEISKLKKQIESLKNQPVNSQQPNNSPQPNPVNQSNLNSL